MRGRLALQKHFVQNPNELADFRASFESAHASSRRFRKHGFVQRYLHGPGTGITNLPSFSATKFSELLEELPFASLFSTLITSFFVGLRFRQTLPVGPSIGVVAFLTSSGVRLTSSIFEIFSPALARLHHFVKLKSPGI